MYKLTKDSNTVRELPAGEFIQANSVVYKAWLAEGNTPEPEFTQQELDAQIATAARQTEIKAARDASGLREMSVVQVHAEIDSLLDAATTLAQLRTATKKVLKKLAAYTLK